MASASTSTLVMVALLCWLQPCSSLTISAGRSSHIVLDARANAHRAMAVTLSADWHEIHRDDGRASGPAAPKQLHMPRRVLLASAAAAALPTTVFADGERLVVLTGASGRTGRLILQLLCQRSISTLAIASSQKSATKLEQAASGGRVAVATCDMRDDGARMRLRELMEQYAATDVVNAAGYVPSFIATDDAAAAEAVDFAGAVRLIEAAEDVRLSGRFVHVTSLLTDLATPNLSYQVDQTCRPLRNCPATKMSHENV
eukprot:4317148-Pleurochrysis_carterae.AAC.1